MGRKRKPYRLKKRGKIYYYKLMNSERFLTTGCTSKTDADLFVSNKLVRYGYQNVESMLFSKYAEPFLIGSVVLMLVENVKKVVR